MMFASSEALDHSSALRAPCPPGEVDALMIIPTSRPMHFPGRRVPVSIWVGPSVVSAPTTAAGFAKCAAAFRLLCITLSTRGQWLRKQIVSFVSLALPPDHLRELGGCMVEHDGRAAA